MVVRRRGEQEGASRTGCGGAQLVDAGLSRKRSDLSAHPPGVWDLLGHNMGPAGKLGTGSCSQDQPPTPGVEVEMPRERLQASMGQSPGRCISCLGLVWVAPDNSLLHSRPQILQIGLSQKQGVLRSDHVECSCPFPLQTPPQSEHPHSGPSRGVPPGVKEPGHPPLEHHCPCGQRRPSVIRGQTEAPQAV